MGVDASLIAKEGSALALSESTYAFKRPLRSRDKFSALLWISRLTPARIVFAHEIRMIPGGELVCEGTATAVSLGPNYAPVRLSKELTAAMHTFVRAPHRSVYAIDQLQAGSDPE